MGIGRELLGAGYVGLGGDRLPVKAAQYQSQQHMLDDAERDQRRKEARDAIPHPVPRWRWHHGVWQRWFELDGDFATLEPPGTLVEHAAATGGPVDGLELRFVDGAWTAATGDDPAPHPEAGTAAQAVARVPVPDVAPPAATIGLDLHLPPPPVSQPSPDEARENFEAQLAAWRRRR